MVKSIAIGDTIFKTQKECENYTRQILTEMGITDSVKLKNNDNFIFLCLLCKRHPHYNEKFPKFVDFQVNRDGLNKKGFALNILNNDGTVTEISWRICVSGKDKTDKTLFNSALRHCISYQIIDFKYTSDLSYCRECNCCLNDKVIHIDHHEKQFKQLVEEFLELNRDTIIIPTEYNKKEITFETLFTNEDRWIGKLFEKYHLENATLRVLCETCNLTREKYKSKILCLK